MVGRADQARARVGFFRHFHMEVSIIMLLLLFSFDIFSGFLTVDLRRRGFVGPLCKLRFKNGLYEF